MTTINIHGRTNEQILKADKAFLDGIQKQHRFLMHMHLQRRACPNCGHPSNLPEAAGIAFDDYDFGTGTRDRDHSCSHCKRTLIYTLPWPTGVWYWRLDPKEAIVNANASGVPDKSYT